MTDIPIRSGDLILMLSTGPVSAMIAWCGDSAYSHAALMADNGDMMEASASGVRRYPLAKRLADSSEVVYLDAFRSVNKAGLPLSDAERAAVVAAGEVFLGTPYEFGKLLEIGIISAVRQKLPEHPLARYLVREALDHLLQNDGRAMICSEFVYTSFLLAKLAPPGPVTPTVVVAPPSGLPFPKIDWVAFAKEMWQLLQARPHAAALRATASPETLGVDIGDDELTGRMAQARAKLGVGGLLASSAPAAAGSVVPNPNPKLVTPLDLASSPSHSALGRLVQY